MLKKDFILKVGITNDTDENILEYILHRLKIDKKFYIVTPNPEILVYASRHENYKNILNNAEISLADGTGLFLASILMGKPFKQRIPGIEFLEKLCKNTVRNPISMGFLGGRRGVAQRTAECLKKKYPHLNVVFVGEEWSEAGFEYGDKADSRRQVARHTPHSIDILFVAFGHPKQEEWIQKNLEKLPIKVAMGVGGAFDYISGEVKRAPFMIRAIGFEWFYRLITQPWRWRRQLSLIEFIKLVVKEIFRKK